MKLVVGLGNPGRKYRGTRHNVGFEVIAELHQRKESPRPAAKFDSEIVQITVADQKTLLQSPLTYMNKSGRSVKAAIDFYKLSLDDVLIVCDDFNLTLGRLRFRPNGSAGGQNGLKDIIRQLGTDQISRLRIGIGHPPPQWDVSDFVLSRFAEDQSIIAREAIRRAAEGVEIWVERGTIECMNRFNADPNKKTKPASADDETINATNKSRGDEDRLG